MENTQAYETSQVEALPFINLDPGNLSTLYTALPFATEECRRCGQDTCLVTFDQPLYIKAVDIVHLMHLFLRPERLGDWELHLHAIQKKLSHFHAAGHLAYAKSAHLYVQQMEELCQKMNAEEYEQLTQKGFFTIC